MVPLESADIWRVVSIHRAALGYSLNARLGAFHLSYVYERTARQPYSMVAVAKVDGTVAGAVSATLDPERAGHDMIVGLTVARRLAVGLALAVHPWWWLDVLEHRRLSAPTVHQGTTIQPCLTSIVVDKAFQGQGVALRLVDAVDTFVRGAGCTAYRLDTRTGNERACAFYRKAGFIEHARLGRNVIFIKELQQHAHQI